MSQTVRIRVCVLVAALCALSGSFDGFLKAEPPASKNEKSGVLSPYVGPTIAAPKNATAVVVLPPKLPEGASAALTQAAESICDRLAGEIAALGKQQIVNRNQLDQILNERKLSGNFKPITGYSAMIRLEVELHESPPQAVLTILDLSSGNPTAQGKFGWPLSEDDVPALREVCQSGLKRLDVPKAGVVRVRLLGVSDTGTSYRLKPLAYRLEQVFNSALGQTKEIVLVQHLAAQSAREEALLLLMGLSRLPGGRQFTPQSDAILELRLLEKDAIGKTFAETTVAIGMQLKGADKPAQDWLEVSGTVADFDPLIERAWQELAKHLTSIRPETAGKSLNEMRLRREQAEAEVKNAQFKLLRATGPGGLAVNRDAIDHLEAALKLDPRYTDAHYQLLRALSNEQRLTNDTASDPVAVRLRRAKRFVFETAAYLQRPDGKVDDRLDVIAKVAWQIRPSEWPPTQTVFDKPPAPSEQAPSIWDQTDQQLLDALQVILSCASKAPGNKGYLSQLDSRFMQHVHRGMMLAGTTSEQRTQWADEILKTVDTRMAEAIAENQYLSSQDIQLGQENWRTRVRLMCAEFAAEDGLHDRALQLLALVRSDVKLIRFGQDDQFVPRMHKVLKTVNDPQPLQEFEAWRMKLPRSAFVRELGALQVKWPQLHPRYENDLDLKLPVTTIRKLHRDKSPPHHPYLFVIPLAASKDRIYLQLSEGRGREANISFGYIPLDPSGNPLGRDVEVKVPRALGKHSEWDEIRLLPPLGPPDIGRIYQAATDASGRLIIGVDAAETVDERAGITIFDPQTGKWTRINITNGLPIPSVRSFVFLNDHLLYCAGRYEGSAHFTVDLDTKECKLLHKSDEKKGHYFSFSLVPLWKNGDRLDGPFNTDLLSSHPKQRPNWQTAPISQAHFGATMGNRRFLMNREYQLFEFDAQEKLVQAYDPPRDRSSFESVYVPRARMSPPHPGPMVRVGKYLAFIHSSITLFEPTTNAWYGPVGFIPSSTSGIHRGIVGTDNRLWFPDSLETGTIMVDPQELIYLACAAGRVSTSEQFRTEMFAHIEQLPPIEHVKALVMLRDMRRAAKELSQLLQEDPENPELLLLMGLVHEPFGLNDPEQALRHYRQLSLHQAPNAQLAGLICTFDTLYRTRQWQPLIETGEKILDFPPELRSDIRRRVEGTMKQAKSQTTTNTLPNSLDP